MRKTFGERSKDKGPEAGIFLTPELHRGPWKTRRRDGHFQFNEKWLRGSREE